MTTNLMRTMSCYGAVAVVVSLSGAARQAPTKDSPAIEKAYVDDKGSVHIVQEGGKETVVAKEKDPVGDEQPKVTGSEQVKIAEDKRTVGWAVDYENCCTSYAIPLSVAIWKDGKIVQKLGDGMMIYDWRFWEGGKQVAFCSGTVHGDSGGHCELHDALTGKTLDAIDGHLNDDSPKWARGLRN